uniref:Uncharacterized protein n=1 Tax=Rhizophora mucronata TaxID=61149 RepID=A0A2P2LMD9_RHIMU
MRAVLSSNPIPFDPILLPYHSPGLSISRPSSSNALLNPIRSSLADNSSKAEISPSPFSNPFSILKPV